MSAVAELELPRRGLAARMWSGVLAAWGAFIGLLPHVLHHVGPLAGAALLCVADALAAGNADVAERKSEDLLAAVQRFSRTR